MLAEVRGDRIAGHGCRARALITRATARWRLRVVAPCACDACNLCASRSQHLSDQLRPIMIALARTRKCCRHCYLNTRQKRDNVRRASNGLARRRSASNERAVSAARARSQRRQRARPQVRQTHTRARAHAYTLPPPPPLETRWQRGRRRRFATATAITPPTATRRRERREVRRDEARARSDESFNLSCALAFAHACRSELHTFICVLLSLIINHKNYACYYTFLFRGGK